MFGFLNNDRALTRTKSLNFTATMVLEALDVIATEAQAGRPINLTIILNNTAALHTDNSEISRYIQEVCNTSDVGQQRGPPVACPLSAVTLINQPVHPVIGPGGGAAPVAAGVPPPYLVNLNLRAGQIFLLINDTFSAQATTVRNIARIRRTLQAARLDNNGAALTARLRENQLHLIYEQLNSILPAVRGRSDGHRYWIVTNILINLQHLYRITEAEYNDRCHGNSGNDTLFPAHVRRMQFWVLTQARLP